MTREEAIERYGEPDKMGHVTRFSDSSLYDEVCVLCGLTDGSLMMPRPNTTLNTRCVRDTVAP